MGQKRTMGLFGVRKGDFSQVCVYKKDILSKNEKWWIIGLKSHDEKWKKIKTLNPPNYTFLESWDKMMEHDESPWIHTDSRNLGLNVSLVISPFNHCTPWTTPLKGLSSLCLKNIISFDISSLDTKLNQIPFHDSFKSRTRKYCTKVYWNVN